MSDNLNDIGEVFRKSLKDLKMESNEQLWDKLDQRLSSQTVVTPKKAFLHTSHISWVSVAAAASLITFVSFAAYYFSTKRNESTIANNKHNSTNTKAISNIKDSTFYVNNQDTTKSIRNNTDDITKLTPRSINNIDNNINTVLNKQYPKPQLIRDNKNKKPDKNVSPPNSNNNTNSQPQFTNNNYNSFPPNSYNQSPIVQPNNSTNNNKTTKPNPSNNNQQTTIYPYNNKVTLPIDTSKAINPNDNNAIPNSNDVVNKPEPDANTLKIPNIFTPNGDGKNDYFVIENIQTCSNTELIIHDRVGKVVYEKLNYQNDWDGRGLPDGVYFYTFLYHQSDGKMVKQGSVTIIR